MTASVSDIQSYLIFNNAEQRFNFCYFAKKPMTAKFEISERGAAIELPVRSELETELEALQLVHSKQKNCEIKARIKFNPRFNLAVLHF